jgi:hypothetical protein
MQKELIELLRERQKCLEDELIYIDRIIKSSSDKCKHENVERYTLHTSTLVVCKECGKTERE